MKDSESELKSKLSRTESRAADLASDLKKLRTEFETLSKNHLRTTEELNRFFIIYFIFYIYPPPYQGDQMRL
jgi:molecular chaperone GrpE (heat shock protein)